MLKIVKLPSHSIGSHKLESVTTRGVTAVAKLNASPDSLELAKIYIDGSSNRIHDVPDVAMVPKICYMYWYAIKLMKPGWQHGHPRLTLGHRQQPLLTAFLIPLSYILIIGEKVVRLHPLLCTTHVYKWPYVLNLELAGRTSWMGSLQWNGRLFIEFLRKNRKSSLHPMLACQAHQTTLEGITCYVDQSERSSAPTLCQ
eukprot:scaffold16796_cov70-Attheya_sp.AAC.2